MKKQHFQILALAGVVLALPLFLSRRMRVLCRIVIRATPAEIFPLINDLRNWPLWTEWSRREEMHLSYEGPPSGVGAIQKWSTGRMEGELKISQSLPDERIAYHLEIDGGKYHLDGIISLEPFGEVTRVTWFCKWTGSANPYARCVDLFCKFMIKRDFAAGLANLKELSETQSRGCDADCKLTRD